jgi:probable F420-dependent oxidoreductase
MELGLHLPHFGPLATAEVLERVIDTCERVGLDSVWVGDHVVIPERIESRYPYHESGSASFNAQAAYYEPFALLAYAAGRTRRVRLGLSVLVVPYRHPLLTMKTVGTLDQLSRGRMIVGVGAGWLREEFEVLGVDFEARGRITDEYVQTMSAGWASSPLTWGDRAVGSEPRPVQQPRPPLLVGGHTHAAMRRALRLADGWQASANDPEELTALVARLRQLAGGALPEGFRVGTRAHLPRFDPGGHGDPGPDDLRALVEAYRRAGADHLVVDLWDRDPDRYVARLEAFASWIPRGRREDADG